MGFDHDVRDSVVLVHEERRALEGRCGVELEYRSAKIRNLVERHTSVMRDLHEDEGVGNVRDWGGAESTSLNRRGGVGVGKGGGEGGERRRGRWGVRGRGVTGGGGGDEGRRDRRRGEEGGKEVGQSADGAGVVGEELIIRHGGYLGSCGERRKEDSVRRNMRRTGERGARQ